MFVWSFFFKFHSYLWYHQILCYQAVKKSTYCLWFCVQINFTKHKTKSRSFWQTFFIHDFTHCISMRQFISLCILSQHESVNSITCNLYIGFGETCLFDKNLSFVLRLFKSKVIHTFISYNILTFLIIDVKLWIFLQYESCLT